MCAVDWPAVMQIFVTQIFYTCTLRYSGLLNYHTLLYTHPTSWSDRLHFSSLSKDLTFHAFVGNRILGKRRKYSGIAWNPHAADTEPWRILRKSKQSHLIRARKTSDGTVINELQSSMCSRTRSLYTFNKLQINRIWFTQWKNLRDSILRCVHVHLCLSVSFSR